MSLAERLQSDLTTAMKSGDALRRDTLRMALSALKNRRIELGRDLEDADVLGVLASGVKSRTDSARQYAEAGRPELAEKERAEIAVLEGYLPRKLDEAETARVVEAKIAELGVTTKADLGRLMKAVMAEHKGAVDGKLVQRLAAERLA